MEAPAIGQVRGGGDEGEEGPVLAVRKVVAVPSVRLERLAVGRVVDVVYIRGVLVLRSRYSRFCRSNAQT
jgi:hypothetical protein